ncbi:hypothetical protein KSP39_PZI012305 [Platanthera zijinensis]|uniref:Uncharacterized protein n=1 Tax=Platanthera zijinensis TaxID=2320716 RepID=A0AAP0G4Y5_9ASPA
MGEGGNVERSTEEQPRRSVHLEMGQSSTGVQTAGTERGEIVFEIRAGGESLAGATKEEKRRHRRHHDVAPLNPHPCPNSDLRTCLGWKSGSKEPVG